MTKNPPPEQGCARATFPQTTWEQVPCTTAPSVPYLPRAPGPANSGGTTDFITIAPGTISSARGIFEDTGTGPGAIGDPGSFSIQLNTNKFQEIRCPTSTPICAWEQFLLQKGLDDQGRDDPNAASVFIQYWLINATVCPNDGWTFVAANPMRKTAGGCWANSKAVPVPVTAVTNLAGLEVTATAAAGGADTVVLGTPEGLFSPDASSNQDLGLFGNWNAFEFNVVGNGNGSNVAFSPGSTLVVETEILAGDSFTFRTTCSGGFKDGPSSGFTAETNNMSLGAPCDAQKAGILFSEGVPPVITDMSPTEGDETGGTTVILTGSGFSNDSEVAFGSLFVGTEGCTTVQCKVGAPRGTGKVAVSIANLSSGGFPGPLSAAPGVFAFEPFPGGVMSPGRGPVAGGTPVSLVGRNFGTSPGATTVTFGFSGAPTAAGNLSCGSTTLCTMTTPPLTPEGPGPVVIPVTVTVDGRSNSLGGFTFGPPPSPPVSFCQQCVDAGGVCIFVEGKRTCKISNQ